MSDLKERLQAQKLLEELRKFYDRYMNGFLTSDEFKEQFKEHMKVNYPAIEDNFCTDNFVNEAIYDGLFEEEKGDDYVD
jgi:hypothetical protein